VTSIVGSAMTPFSLAPSCADATPPTAQRTIVAAPQAAAGDFDAADIS